MGTKIKLWCDSGANIHSRREDEIDVSDWGFSDEDWKNLGYQEKMNYVNEWANDRLEIGFEEVN